MWFPSGKAGLSKMCVVHTSCVEGVFKTLLLCICLVLPITCASSLFSPTCLLLFGNGHQKLPPFHSQTQVAIFFHLISSFSTTPQIWGRVFCCHLSLFLLPISQDITTNSILVSYLDLSFLVKTRFLKMMWQETHRNVWTCSRPVKTLREDALLTASQIRQVRRAPGTPLAPINWHWQWKLWPQAVVLRLLHSLPHPVLLPCSLAMSQSKSNLVSFHPKQQPAHLHAARTQRHAGVCTKSVCPLCTNRPFWNWWASKWCVWLSWDTVIWRESMECHTHTQSVGNKLLPTTHPPALLMWSGSQSLRGSREDSFGMIKGIFVEEAVFVWFLD